MSWLLVGLGLLSVIGVAALVLLLMVAHAFAKAFR